MSKIYEALQRAEQERQQRTGLAPAPPATPAPAPVSTAVSTALEPAQAPAQPSPQSPTQPPLPAPVFSHEAALAAQAAAPPIPLLEDPLADDEARPLDLTGVPTTLWQPILQKLPALEERGAGVEQFRSLRTRLFAFRDLNKLKSILVSSGMPREGKSFIAANLAISFARHKASRVLLIDGDMRRSSLHTLLGCSRTPGLTNYLAGDANLLQIMQRAQVNQDGSPLFSGLGSLTFIGGGDEGDKAADLSGSKRFHKLLERAAPYFDWIVVDSSPVNLVTDGVNLAAACDAVLMVARSGVTKFEAAQRAMVELKSSKILGVVLNAVEELPHADGYYGYAGYDSVEANPGPTAGSTSP